MRGGIRQDAEKKRSGASTIRRKRRREGESGVVWTSGECDVASGRKKCCDVASGRKERCDASQAAQDAQDGEYPALASRRNAGGSDSRSVFPDVCSISLLKNILYYSCRTSYQLQAIHTSHTCWSADHSPKKTYYTIH